MMMTTMTTMILLRNWRNLQIDEMEMEMKPEKLDGIPSLTKISFIKYQRPK